MKRIFLYGLIFLILLPILASAAPTSYLDEKIEGDFFVNGTLKELTKKGYVKVAVGNNQDVLQYIEITLGSTENTNLVSNTAYRGTASSPYGDDKNRLFFNTTDPGENLYYRIEKGTPIINISLDYENTDGGKDLHHGYNTLNFEIILESNQTLNNVSFDLQVRKDVYQGNDAMNIINPTATSYENIGRTDTDNDGIYDKMSWSGDLDKEVTIVFDGEITPGINFDENQRQVNLAGSCEASYSQSSIFSETKIEDRFSRGPVRQGIDLSQTGEYDWVARAFMKNMASDLKYKINNWGIYEVGNETPIASSSKGFELGPGEISYTEQYPVGEKRYFSSSYDWEIIWGDSFETGAIESEIDLPKLYEIDSSLEKFLVIEKNSQDEGRELTVRDRVRHLGSEDISVDKVEFYSLVPATPEEGGSTSWSIGNVTVQKRIGPNTFDITHQANITTKNSNGGDGFVDAEIKMEEPLEQNQDILLIYTVTSPSSTEAQNYTFSTNSTLITESGTPEKRYKEESIQIPGVGVPPAPPGVPAVPAKKNAGILKEDSRAWVVGNIGNIDVTYKVFDTGTKGIRDNKLMILAPEEGDLQTLSLQIYRNKKWSDFTIDEDYVIKDMGVASVGEKNYHQYLIQFKEKLDLYDGEKLRARYKTSLEQGRNEIVTKMSGYNYYEDKIISEEVHSLVMVRVKVSKLDIKESKWKQQRAMVGEPVAWIKHYEIKNSNDFRVEEYITSETFKDVISVYRIENGKKTKISLTDTKARFPVDIEPNGKRWITLKAFTPPVIETQRNVEPIFVGERKPYSEYINYMADLEIKRNETDYFILKLNSTIKNFAKETYENVTYILENPRENIIDHENIKLLDREEKTWGLWDLLYPSQSKNFFVTYKQKPPILIMKLNNYNFTQQERAVVDIMVIPRETGGGYLELEINGPEPELRTQYGDIMSVGNKPKNFKNKVGLKGFQPGKYSVDAKFKKEFVTMVSAKKKFYVTGERIKEISFYILLILLLIFILAMAKRIYKRKERFEREMERLRRKLRGV